MYKGHSITAIIPCLNEEQGVEEVLSRMPDYVDEVIVVDNGSTDRTADVALARGAKVIREDIRGYGRAYKKGFGHATGDIIVTLDGDHSYPVDAISYLLEAFLHLSVDFLNASRFPVRDRAAMSFKHKIGNLILSVTMSVLFFFFRWVRDSQSGMWVFRRSILNQIRLDADGMAFSEEIKVEAIKNPRIRFDEIPVMYTSRLGEIKLNPWRDGVQNLLYLFKKRLQF
jgi:glycosyltransferase involved in cell wall biosynthesis